MRFNLVEPFFGSSGRCVCVPPFWCSERRWILVLWCSVDDAGDCCCGRGLRKLWTERLILDWGRKKGAYSLRLDWTALRKWLYACEVDGEEEYCFFFLSIGLHRFVRMKSVLIVDGMMHKWHWPQSAREQGLSACLSTLFSAEHGDAVVRFESFRGFLVNNWHVIRTHQVLFEFRCKSYKGSMCSLVDQTTSTGGWLMLKRWTFSDSICTCCAR